MSSVEFLREFVNERLSAAAEEIFGVFQKTFVEYEEEIRRQRRLLDVVWKPDIQIPRIELPQHPVCEEQVLSEEQLCIQERNSSLDQEDPEPPQIKEEQEDLCTSPEGEQLGLEQDTDAFMLTATEEASEHQLLSHNSHVAESQDQEGGEQDSGSTSSAKPKPQNQHRKRHQNKLSEMHCDTRQDSGESARNAEPKKRNQHPESKSHRNNANNTDLLEMQSDTHTGKQPLKCDKCEKYFKYRSSLERHLIIHTGEKPYSCNTCGKRFTQKSKLNYHTKTHKGETSYSCKICGESFKYDRLLTVHIKQEHSASVGKDLTGHKCKKKSY
ncbi:GDNF-inducible zinc finger protein 1-like [Gymnodraco acuticeps]|uniref:GDNF-inducible zinc finger protein 1-like n=1 Tax=Gymnodraco acuticeps TaxID=8218 RepID=A0A6P8VQI1_GYMAC|nr:GDNF-inducible zinc finger protein 1-like [Gymnodraco acuticeps]